MVCLRLTVCLYRISDKICRGRRKFVSGFLSFLTVSGFLSFLTVTSAVVFVVVTSAVVFLTV